MTSGGESELVVRAAAGDEDAFAATTAPHERSLFRHCYRMLGSGEDAEEAVQDTLIRAWRAIDGFQGRGPFGGWLYRIATNVCLDQLKAERARVDTEPSAWVEPVDDRRLADPHDDLLRKEEISLAFVVALQRLAPRQRACLLLHDVLGFNQTEVAEALEMTPAGVNSALFRARRAARPRTDEVVADLDDPVVRDLLDRYVRAWHLCDVRAFLELVADDVRLSMPPLPLTFAGRGDVAHFVEEVIFASSPSGIPLRAGWCNGQPAFATYEPTPDGGFVANGLQVVTLRSIDGRVLVSDIVSFRDPELAARCGLPPRI